jgi:hypothetical protein
MWAKMLVTATTWVILVIVSLALLALGFYSRNVLSYGLGCFLLFMLGMLVLFQGFAEPVGAEVSYNISGNVTLGETHTTVYETNKGWWTDFLGIAASLGALGLFSMAIVEMRAQREKEKNNLDLGE